MASGVYLWRRAPFMRFLFCLMAGIVVQWHVQVHLTPVTQVLLLSFLFLVLYSFFNANRQYQYRAAAGIALHLLVAAAGALLVWTNDVRNDPHWLGHHYTGQQVTAVLQEPLVEKANSYKALANVVSLQQNNQQRAARGQIIVYLKKDSAFTRLTYGSTITFSRRLQEIRNAGNPGSFDYKTYSLFQGITHQVYLGPADLRQSAAIKTDALRQWIFTCRQWVVITLQRYIPGRKEAGLAEALLIGYKDDLDKSLVEAYSNTGVVHVIAISGLHLGLIYWLLLLLTRPLKGRRHLAMVRLLLLLVPLWAFTLLAGAQPSVVRSAVMFSCIAFGEIVARKASIYNTLALSAFVLLCFNPFWLWDVGFQLSYAAVLSIVTFFRPVYNWFTFSNKILDFLWKMNAVTIAAQLLTVPISMYHFHQFPVIFFFTNFVAVPLSSVVLIGEIILCIVAFLPALANAVGGLLGWLIYGMNNYIEHLDQLSFAVWPSMYLSTIQMLLVAVFVASSCFWLIEKQRALFWCSLAALFSFILLRSISFYDAYQQKKLVVYNVPKYRAMDLIDGRNVHFIGDTHLLQDGFIRNFHLNPSRIRHRISLNAPALATKGGVCFGNRNIFIVDAPVATGGTRNKAEILILSGTPRLYISQLQSTFDFKQLVIDGSVPAWKATLWKRDCDSLGISYHDVTEKGAFVMEL